MTRRQHDECDLDLGAEDRRFLETLAEAYKPAPLEPARRAAIRRGVDDRLERRRRPRALVLAVAPAAVAALAAWLVIVAPSPAPPPIEEGAPFAWEEKLFFSNDVAELTPDAEDEFLPDDYEAIAAYLLEI